MGLFVLAASCATIWKAACLFDLDASNNSQSKAILFRFALEIDAPLQAIMIWVPYTDTNGQWIASKLLQGFFGAPVESLCEISVTDIVRDTAKALLLHALNSFSILPMKVELT